MQMILLKKYYNITFFGNCELWTIRPWCRVAALNWPLSFFVDFSWIFPIINFFFFFFCSSMREMYDHFPLHGDLSSHDVSLLEMRPPFFNQ